MQPPFPLLLACAGGPAVEEHTDGIPEAETAGPDGWSARVEAGGRLVVDGPDGQAWRLAGEALPEVAFAPEGDRFAYARNGPEAEIVVVPLPPDGSERVVVDWQASADRPAFSPDGRWLAFVSGRTGIASLWLVDLSLPNPGAAARQLTNEGLGALEHEPGRPPPGFVPPPCGAPTWTASGLAWAVDGQSYTVEAP